MQFNPALPMQYTFKSVSGTEFLIRLLTGLAMLSCIGNAIAILTGRVDLVSWFTGFTVFNRDALGLFVAYAAAGVFFAAITFKWRDFLWWVAIVLAGSLFYAGWGLYYGNSNKDTGPSMMDTLGHKFNFDNIKSISGATVPVAGSTTDTTTQSSQKLPPLSETRSQAVTQPNAAQQRAIAAQKQEVATHTARFKKQGFAWKRHLNDDEVKWCENKSARAKFKALHPAREWIAEGRCVTKLQWENK